MQSINSARLREQTTMSLADRAAQYEAEHPGEKLSRQDLGKYYKKLGVRSKMIRKQKDNPQLYPPERVAELTNELRAQVIAADAEGRQIWNVDEVHFRLSDHKTYAWAMPGETPTVPERPLRGLKTCSVIAAACVATGELMFDLGEKFQKKEDVIRFVDQIRIATPLDKSVAILWDNASSHRAAATRQHLRNSNIVSIMNVPYHP